MVARRRPDPPFNPAIGHFRAELAASTAISAAAQPIIDGFFLRWEGEYRLVVPRKVARETLSVSSSHEIDLENKGELHAILLGGQRMVTVNSIYKRLILKTIETFPVEGGPKKSRTPPDQEAMRAAKREQEALRADKRDNVLEREPIEAMGLEADRIEAPSAPKRARGRPRKYARKYQAELTAQ